MMLQKKCQLAAQHQANQQEVTPPSRAVGLHIAASTFLQNPSGPRHDVFPPAFSARQDVQVLSPPILWRVDPGQRTNSWIWKRSPASITVSFPTTLRTRFSHPWASPAPNNLQQSPASINSSSVVIPDSTEPISFPTSGRSGLTVSFSWQGPCRPEQPAFAKVLATYIHRRLLEQADKKGCWEIA